MLDAADTGMSAWPPGTDELELQLGTDEEQEDPPPAAAASRRSKAASSSAPGGAAPGHSASAAAPAVVSAPTKRRLRQKTTAPPGFPADLGTDEVPTVDKRLIKQKTPTLNLKDVVQQLTTAKAADVPKLLLALHWRFWHAPAARICGLLRPPAVQKEFWH